jgi:hypothetical protein
MIEGTIVLKHKTTGKLYYTFERWPRQDSFNTIYVSVVSEVPNMSKTQVVDFIPEDELEIVE